MHFNLPNILTFSRIAAIPVLLALFIYWGWDSCLALNEETKDPKRIPGRAALLTTVISAVVCLGLWAIAHSGLTLDDVPFLPRFS